jgi:hypothetical protein
LASVTPVAAPVQLLATVLEQYFPMSAKHQPAINEAMISIVQNKPFFMILLLFD